MSVTIIEHNPTETTSAPVPPSKSAPPVTAALPQPVVIYHWTVGAIAFLLVVGLLFVPSEGLQLTSLVNFTAPSISFALVCAIIFIIGSIACNYFAAILPATKGYLTLSMLFYLAAYLALDPLVAALVPLVASLWFELFIGRRGWAYAARTCGMYVFCELAAGYAYRAMDGGAILSDLTLAQGWRVLLSFVIFRLVNDIVFQLTSTFQNGLFFKPFFVAMPSIYLVYGAMLPGALILATLVSQTGLVMVIMGAAIVVGVGILLKRFSDSSLAERQQLELSQELNARLVRQNERQAALGNRINTTLDSFLALVRDYAATSHEQETAIVEITATIEELSHTAAQIAASTDKVAAAADKAIDAADRGQNAVTNTVAAISEVQDKVRHISATILDLNQKSEQIGDIVNTINQIAGEIRLLALNATIEASGAGKYGRRFAVVAGEVSNLADRSREASGAIRRIISEIRTATTSSVHATEEGLQLMQRSIAIALQSEKANNEIIEMVERTARTAAAIALATQQQLSASEQVVNSMHDVASTIGENAQKVAGVSVASLELQRVSRELRIGE